MITDISQKLALNDGNNMPGFGYGCYKAHGEELLAGIATAWQCGYRLFDTAAFYEQEDTVGDALKPYPVQDFFLVSKIWPTSYDSPVKALDTSLKKLKRDYLDAYLLHWPGLKPAKMLSAWEKLLREQEKGKIHTLGVSNFLQGHLEELRSNFDAYPAINQLEIHPLFQQKALCQFCSAQNIAVMAWSPIGRGDALKLPKIVQIASQIAKTPAQVILRWHIQENHISIPKSVHANRIRENAEIFDFSLDEKQIAAINSLDKPDGSGRRGPDPLAFAAD